MLSHKIHNQRTVTKGEDALMHIHDEVSLKEQADIGNPSLEVEAELRSERKYAHLYVY